MRHKKIIVFFLLFILVFTSGCWDKIETGDRGFIAAIAIDINEEAMKKQEEGKKVFSKEKPDVVKIAFGMVNPSKLLTGDKAFSTRTVTGTNLADAVENLTASSSRVPFFGHTQLVVFTEKFAGNQQLFKDVIDELERNPLLNRQMKVTVMSGTSEEVFKIEPKLENLVAGYVSGIMNNAKTVSNTIDMDLGKFLSDIRDNEGSAVLPVIVLKKGEKEGDVEVNQLALIKDYKFFKMVDSKYIKTYKIVTGKMNAGRNNIDYKDTAIPYFITSCKRTIKLEGDGEKLKYNVKVMLEGDIEEYFFNEEIFESSVINDLKAAIEESVKDELSEGTKYFQNEVGYDYLGFGEYTHKYHNDIYKKNKEKWDEVFKNAEINYEVEANIRRIGTTKK